MRPELAEVEPARRLHRVGVQQGGGRIGPHDLGRGPQVVDRADLVVHRHHRHDRHVIAERRGELVEIGPSVPVGADDAPVMALDDVEHAMVLRRRAHRHATVPPHRPGDRRVVALRPAAGEHHFPGQATDDRGDPVPGIVDRAAGLAGETVGAARVGESLGE